MKNGEAKDHVSEYEKKRDVAKAHNDKLQELMDLIKERVNEKHGDLAPVDFPEPHKTDWMNLQNKRKWEAQYPISMDIIKRFELFCEQSGGFRIC